MISELVHAKHAEPLDCTHRDFFFYIKGRRTHNRWGTREAEGGGESKSERGWGEEERLDESIQVFCLSCSWILWRQCWLRVDTALTR